MTRAAFAPLAVLLLAACATTTPYRRPAAPVAPVWQRANAAPRETDPAWWRRMGDPSLARLVEAGLADNPDIAAAIARLDQARAMARHARAALLPSATSQDSLARERQSIDSGLGRLTTYVPTIARTQNEADIGIAPSWDIDLAGGLSGQARAARAERAGANAALTAARLALAAEIADAYVDLVSAERDLTLAERQRALIADRRTIAAARVRRGAAGPGATDQADATLAAFDAILPSLRTAPMMARNRLAILTGRPAGSDLPELAPDHGLPEAADPAAGVPADLLRHRPDLVLAETRLIANHARVGAALGEYWPKLNLSGLIGYSTTDLSRLGGDSANVMEGAIGLRWRLFDFPRIDAEVAAARGAEREALADYRSNVLRAGGEVENAFLTLAAARAEVAARERARAALGDALHRARTAHAGGELSRDALQDSETRAIGAERDWLAARTALAHALVTCHRALAG